MSSDKKYWCHYITVFNVAGTIEMNNRFYLKQRVLTERPCPRGLVA